MNIELQEFFKVYGNEGVVFVSAEDKEAIEYLYPGTEVTSKKKVKGFGIPQSNGLWEVFTEQSQAQEHYRCEMGGVVSGSMIMEDYGIRERIEA